MHWNLKAAQRGANRSGHCACLQTAISKLPINVLTPPLDLATLISYCTTNNSHSLAQLDIVVPSMSRNCYFQACGQTFDIVMKSSDTDFLKTSNIWLSYDVFRLFFYCTDKNVHNISISGSFDLMTLNTTCVTCCAPQPIRSWIITFLQLIRYFFEVRILTLGQDWIRLGGGMLSQSDLVFM